MALEDSKAQGYLTGSFEIKNPNISKTTAVKPVADTSRKSINSEVYKNTQTLGKTKFMLSKCSLQKDWPAAILLLNQVIFSLPHCSS